MKNLIALILLFLTLPAKAQIDNFSFGGRAWGMGNASVTLKDAWGIWNNTANISEIDKINVVFGYDNRFNVSAFQTIGLGVVTPVKIGVAGLSFSRFGDELYSEQKIGVGYAYSLDKVSMGLKVNYLQVRIQDLGTKSTFVLEFGGTAQLTKQIFFAAHVYNLNQAKMQTQSGEEQDVPVIMKAGLAYQANPKVLVNAEVEKHTDFDANVKVGIEYQIIQKLFLRTGVQSEPFNGNFGVGFHPKRFQFDYALGTNNSDLGLTHHISLGIRLGK